MIASKIKQSYLGSDFVISTNSLLVHNILVTYNWDLAGDSVRYKQYIFRDNDDNIILYMNINQGSSATFPCTWIANNGLKVDSVTQYDSATIIYSESG